MCMVHQYLSVLFGCLRETKLILSKLELGSLQSFQLRAQRRTMQDQPSAEKQGEVGFVFLYAVVVVPKLLHDRVVLSCPLLIIQDAM